VGVTSAVVGIWVGHRSVLSGLRRSIQHLMQLSSLRMLSRNHAGFQTKINECRGERSGGKGGGGLAKSSAELQRRVLYVW
jgi:hypothetical protein